MADYDMEYYNRRFAFLDNLSKLRSLLVRGSQAQCKACNFSKTKIRFWLNVFSSLIV